MKAETNKSLSAAEREEQELQQAVAMSLDQTSTGQVNGVTGPSNTYFGPAGQDHYDTGKWAMTVSGPAAHEIILNPEPQNRKRRGGAPAFLKPSVSGEYLPSLITILHAIPLAREVLLMREHTLPEYGHDAEWWDGTAINAPRVINLADGPHDRESEDVIYETQRLMAFLDLTERAYGSADVLAGLRTVEDQNQDQSTSNFLRGWQQAAMVAAPDNELTHLFESTGMKVTPGASEIPQRVPFHSLDVEVDLELADKGGTLYDAIDEVLWPGVYDDEDTEETYLDTIGEVVTFRITRQDPSGKGPLRNGFPLRPTVPATKPAPPLLSSISISISTSTSISPPTCASAEPVEPAPSTTGVSTNVPSNVDIGVGDGVGVGVSSFALPCRLTGIRSS